MELDRLSATTDETAVAPHKTQADLEWPRLLSVLAAHCETPMGRDSANALTPVPREELRTIVAQAAEAIDLDRRGEPIPIAAVADVRAAVARVAHGGVLSAAELRAVTAFLAVVRTLRRFLNAHRTIAPLLFEACATDPILDGVEEQLAAAFDPEGTLSDRASPRLKELRAERAAARARMISRIEELLRRHEKILSDQWWTEREGRFVLPVRSDAHERFPGIVHASSASGATLFVEPRLLVPLGNRIKMLDGEVTREEEAVYAALTAHLSEALPSLSSAMDMLTVADLRAATARLARQLGLTIALEPAGNAFEADLRDLRHPLLLVDALDADAAMTLAAARQRVIGSDLRLRAGQAIIISGPNAGGKTVALKALGLACLMLRCGLPIAAQEGSRLGVVETVLTDVGDDQSLQKSLSTFSAHVSNLAHMLGCARPGTLVLLDELCGGTDPREGEALAAAVLDGLCRREAAVVSTTHYEGLKALALGDPRFVNASVGFDDKTLQPTFRLAMGIPGASSALAVASRFGVPSLVIERAYAFLGREERTFEQTVRALNDERRALELARAAAEAEASKLKTAQHALDAERETLRAKDRRLLEREAEELLAGLRRAREDLRLAQGRIRKHRGEQRPDPRTAPAELREVERTLDAVGRQVALGGPFAQLLERADPKEERYERIDADVALAKGTRVFVPRLRAEAEVLAVQGDGQVRVAAGALKLTVARDEIRILSTRGHGTTTRSTSMRRPPVLTAGTPSPQADFEGAESLPVLQTSDNTCDLRGLRPEDAWSMLETFLDRSMQASVRVLFVVHGHGSGAVRDKVREELRRSRYVAKLRPGLADEGGDGVTVVWLP